MNSLVSIIMPVYNNEKFVGQAVESIINQTYQNWELLICDDGSIDESFWVVKKFERIDRRIKIFQNRKNLGKVKTVNDLLLNCSGEYITVHDADDWSEVNRIESQVKILGEKSEVGLVGTFANIVDRNGVFFRLDKREIDNIEIKRKIKSQNQFCGASIIVRRSLIENFLYRPFFNEYNYEDYDLTLRISEIAEVINLPISLYNYRQVAGSLSKKPSINSLISKELVQFLAKQREEFGLDFLEQKDHLSLNEYIKNLKQEYENDPSLIYRKSAESLMHSRLKKEAIFSTVKAIISGPTKLINYRIFQYCIRKTLLGI